MQRVRITNRRFSAIVQAARERFGYGAFSIYSDDTIRHNDVAYGVYRARSGYVFVEA